MFPIDPSKLVEQTRLAENVINRLGGSAVERIARDAEMATAAIDRMGGAAGLRRFADQMGSATDLAGRIAGTAAFDALARQVQAATSSIGRSLVDFQDHFRSQVEAASSALEQFSASMPPVGLQLLALQDAGGPISRHLAELQDRITPQLLEIGRAFERLPERYRTALRTLAAHGWYLDPELSIPEMSEAAELFDSGSVDQGNAELCEYFEGRIDEIECDMAARFPERSRILKQAFAAHRRGDYALSVAVFLAQADGLCKELSGVQLYARRGLALATHLKVDVDSDSFRASLLCPLVEATPITAGPEERKGLGTILNRHTVLHGESVDYDTRLNSCRALSLLAYVGWILDKSEDEPEEATSA